APATGLSNASTRLTRTLFSSTPSAIAPVLITSILDLLKSISPATNVAVAGLPVIGKSSTKASTVTTPAVVEVGWITAVPSAPVVTVCVLGVPSGLVILNTTSTPAIGISNASTIVAVNSLWSTPFATALSLVTSKLDKS